jgi:LysR family transcriptional regulator of abg operon
MQLRHVTAVVAVADTGSMRVGAARVGISQPALTKTIREIEAIAGVALFQKTVRGSILTDAGKVFLSRARSIVEEIRRTQEEMDHLAGVRQGSVTVGLSVGAALLSGAAIETFMRNHPDVQICIIEGLFDELVNGVRQGKLDFSVGGLSSIKSDDHIRVDTLFENRVVPAVRRGHPLARAKSFSELADCEWAVTNDDPSYIANFSNHFAKLGLPAPRIRLRSESFFALLELIPRTDLVLAISHTLLRHPVATRYLQPVAVKESCPTARFSLARKADVPLTPHAAALARLITKATAEVRRQELRVVATGVPRVAAGRSR